MKNNKTNYKFYGRMWAFCYMLFLLLIANLTVFFVAFNFGIGKGIIQQISANFTYGLICIGAMIGFITHWCWTTQENLKLRYLFEKDEELRRSKR